MCQVCRTEYTTECVPVYKPTYTALDPACTKVPREVCDTVQEQRCEKVPEEKCENKKVPRVV